MTSTTPYIISVPNQAVHRTDGATHEICTLRRLHLSFPTSPIAAPCQDLADLDAGIVRRALAVVCSSEPTHRMARAHKGTTGWKLVLEGGVRASHHHLVLRPARTAAPDRRPSTAAGAPKILRCIRPGPPAPWSHIALQPRLGDERRRSRNSDADTHTLLLAPTVRHVASRAPTLRLVPSRESSWVPCYRSRGLFARPRNYHDTAHRRVTRIARLPQETSAGSRGWDGIQARPGNSLAGSRLPSITG